jgi:muconolactone delta-isomerase
MKLVITPKPEKDESFIGYLVRLTEANAYDTPSWILSLSDIDYMELQWTFAFVFDSSKGLEKLAQLTDNALANLTALSYLPPDSSQGETSEHEYNFYGAFLNRSIIRPHCPKICPKCLSESGYCFRVWDCSLVTACPVHECLLLDSCPKCRRRIKCIRKRLSSCPCGCDWREIDPQFLAADELAVSRRVYQLCGLLSETPKEENENRLHSLGLRDFVVVLTFISGMFRSIAWATGRPSKSIKLRNKDLHRLYRRAYLVFENWPHNFHQFIPKQSKGEIRLNPDDGRFDTPLKREFGSFYEHLYRNLDGGQFDFMRESFAEFLTIRLRLQSQESGEKPLPASLSETDTYVSVAEARRLLRISHRAMSDLIVSGEVGFVIRNRGVTLECVLRLFDVENVKRKFEQSLTTRAIAEELGVECEVVRNLARAGHLRTTWRPAVDGYRTIKFDRDSVQALRNCGLINKLDQLKLIENNSLHL